MTLFTLHYLSPDEKDRDSSDVGKILSGTLTVTIVAVLLLALVSCISCHSKYAHIISSVSKQRLNALVIFFFRQTNTEDTQPATSQTQNNDTLSCEDYELPMSTTRENDDEKHEVMTMPAEDRKIECRKCIYFFMDFYVTLCCSAHIQTEVLLQ